MDNSIIIYDPTPFLGGSKIAVKGMLNSSSQHGITADQINTIFVLTLDKKSWNEPGYNVSQLYLMKYLRSKASGPLYYVKQTILFIQVFLFSLYHKKARTFVAISGPGVDAGGLAAAALRGLRKLQLIQGPVAYSRITRYALTWADRIFYLESMKPFLDRLIADLPTQQQITMNTKCFSFANGLNQRDWPSKRQCETPRILWAASLLKWKGLNILQRALLHPDIDPKIAAEVCYITPKQATTAALPPPANTYNLRAWNNPPSLDEIRKSCSIFVSTAENEPFGLSILEAMAAGLCPVIPADGAYWDRVLTDQINCIKYPVGDHIQLAEKLAHAAQNMVQTLAMGEQASTIANTYTAQNCYQIITAYLIDARATDNNSSVLSNTP